ncbi:hypothetical protein NECAME_05124 [Necator americanus]|uniref:Uncharacterized protein n=1 Tax=Necator americanus TaxID=51031 RepID=W2SLT0_NECAM|nr:hypothetical protein NECAME_05124 [Necator americanus]ETN69801.1 hypothetical protein NECAME_05124 [Necator americanus]
MSRVCCSAVIRKTAQLTSSRWGKAAGTADGSNIAEHKTCLNHCDLGGENDYRQRLGWRATTEPAET